MSDNDDWQDPIVLSEQVKAQMAADPELAKALKEHFANMRQAHHAWRSGRYESFEAAMEAITGNRPEPVDLSEDEDDD